MAPGRKAVMARVTIAVGMEESAMLSLWCVGDRASFQARDFIFDVVTHLTQSLPPPNHQQQQTGTRVAAGSLAASHRKVR